jgi:hypothetical protein
MKGKTLILAIAAAAIAAPMATAGVDRGIGIPAGRDAVYAAAPRVSEKTAGLFRPSPSSQRRPAGSTGATPPLARAPRSGSCWPRQQAHSRCVAVG